MITLWSLVAKGFYSPLLTELMEENLISFCGLICNDCPAFIARKTDDEDLRKKTAEGWSTEEFPLEPGDIDCDGCTGESTMKFCAVCDVRICGMEKGIQNCAYCVEYPCKKLEMPWSQSPEAKERLDQIKETL